MGKINKMLRKEAIVRAAFVTHVTKLMISGLFTVRTCSGVPPIVLHLCLERLRLSPVKIINDVLSTIYISKPSNLYILAFYGNTVVKRLC